MTDVSFRRARVADLSAIVALLADDELGRSREDPRQPLDQRYVDAFSAIEADPTQLLAVAEAEGLVVGTIQLTFIRGLSHVGALLGQIEGVRIASARRGTGLGQLMVEWAIAECRSRGCYRVQLTTNRQRHDAHRFYERLGFEPSHIGYKLTL